MPPPARRARPYEVPSSSGMSLINLLSMIWPMVAEPVSSEGRAATTCTSSVTPPGSSVTSSTILSPTRTGILGLTDLRNPDSSAAML